MNRYSKSIFASLLVLGFSVVLGEGASPVVAFVGEHQRKVDLGATFLSAYMALDGSRGAAEAGDWRLAQRELAKAKLDFRKLNAAIRASEPTAVIDPHGRTSRAFRLIEKLIEGAMARAGEQGGAEGRAASSRRKREQPR